MRAVCQLVAAVLLVLGAGVASAQPSAEEKKQAKAAFERAEAAERRKDWRTAIDEYLHAYDLIPHANVLANIALDFEYLEEFREAATYYRRYLDESEDASDHARVEKLIDKLRARPAKLTITTDPPDADVSMDGKRLGPAPVVVKTTGTHELAVASDSGSATRSVTIEFGEPQTVHIAVLARSGVLTIMSNVAGAQVMIDEQIVGTTPFTGAVAAGPHKVVVTSPGWSSYERPVEVPAEGSTQMTANLVRPVGWVAPAVEPKVARAYFLVSGGADVAGDTGGNYSLMFGVHRKRFDFGLGYGFLAKAAGFALEARAFLSVGRVRPYLRVSTLLGSTSTLAGHAGVLGSITLGGPESRAQTSVFLEIGGGMARTDGDFEEPVTTVIVPIVGGLMLSY